jgi:hypothetical protein
MDGSVISSNKAEQEPNSLVEDNARNIKGKATSSTGPASEEQPAPVHSTSAFKPDPFW